MPFYYVIGIVVILFWGFLTAKKVLFATWDRKVKLHSQLYRDLLKLNSRYSFHKIDSYYTYSEKLETKGKFDRFDGNSFFINKIIMRRDWFQDLIEKASSNAKKYDMYLNQYRALYSKTSKEEAQQIKVPFKIFLKIEERLYNQNALPRPVLSPSFDCTISYTSPKGRKWHKNHGIFPLKKLKNCVITPIIL